MSTQAANHRVHWTLLLDWPDLHALRCIQEAQVQAGQHVTLCGGMAGMAAAVTIERALSCLRRQMLAWAPRRSLAMTLSGIALQRVFMLITMVLGNGESA